MRWLLLALVLVGVACGAEPLSPGGYRVELEALAGALARSDQARAEPIADAIAAAQVAWPTGTCPGDPTLATLVHAGDLAQAGRAVAALIADVVRLQGGQAATALAPDPAVLAALAAAARAERLRCGGEVGGNPLTTDNLPVSFMTRVRQAGRWCGDRLGEFWDWLNSWFTDDGSGHGHGHGGVSAITFLVVGMLVVLAVVLALVVWRRRPPPAAPSAGAPLPAQADADPRSRASDQWVAFAHELTRQGRHREAVRAWYHALLVECWSHGVLHHRIGRTNWEYALALSGGLPWRAGFHELTRAFDITWYGGQDDAETARAFAAETQAMLGRVRAPGARP